MRRPSTFTPREKKTLSRLAYVRLRERRENLLLISARGKGGLTPDQEALLQAIDNHLHDPRHYPFPDLA